MAKLVSRRCLPCAFRCLSRPSGRWFDENGEHYDSTLNRPKPRDFAPQTPEIDEKEYKWWVSRTQKRRLPKTAVSQPQRWDTPNGRKRFLQNLRVSAVLRCCSLCACKLCSSQTHSCPMSRISKTLQNHAKNWEIASPLQPLTIEDKQDTVLIPKHFLHVANM